MDKHVIKANLIVDLSERIKNLEKEFEREARRAADSLLRDHFDSGQYGRRKGPGYLELELLVDQMFGTPEIKTKMENIFQEKFETILTQSMEKAIAHKTNAFAFANARELIKEPAEKKKVY